MEKAIHISDNTKEMKRPNPLPIKIRIEMTQNEKALEMLKIKKLKAIIAARTEAKDVLEKIKSEEIKVTNIKQKQTPLHSNVLSEKQRLFFRKIGKLIKTVHSTLCV